MSTTAELDEAIQSAHQAYSSWSKLTIKHRCQILIRFHQLIAQKYAGELSDLIVKEHGTIIYGVCYYDS
jgi:malonate-semialdehyde dehydrogenase (acetylating)/methylmalonate-semialdehyde dehydrogenase